jgi:hypothetical protein
VIPSCSFRICSELDAANCLETHSASKSEGLQVFCCEEGSLGLSVKAGCICVEQGQGLTILYRIDLMKTDAQRSAAHLGHYSRSVKHVMHLGSHDALQHG